MRENQERTRLPSPLSPQPSPLLDCQACGACCVDYFGTAGYIELLPAERPRMRALELPVVTWHGQKLLATRAHDGPGGATCCAAFSGAVGGRCECTIHPERPAACRAFEAGSLGCLFAREAAGLGGG
ncbi:MAG: YkgJ family cysteine cluster protein [Gemmataceae bacterium]